jgi:hypothetical protein
MNPNKTEDLAYLITVGRNHFLPTVMLLATLTGMTNRKIYLVGNLDTPERKWLEKFPVTYIDENDIDLSGRVPSGEWKTTYREWGWYKQQFLRLCADRFIDAEHVVILDSEVFVFDNWDESRFFTPLGEPKCLYWISKARKSEGNYMMYRGAAYLYKDLPGFSNIMSYANSDDVKRYISGVSLFSTHNLAHIWKILGEQTDLEKNMRVLLSEADHLAFSEYQFYGMAMEYKMCDAVVKTELSNELLGWYDVHHDENFDIFRSQNPMWSMCQRYYDSPSPRDYINYMEEMANALGCKMPPILMPRSGV